MNRFFQSLLTILFTMALCSCAVETLSIHTEYLNEEHLASYHINTPDPLLLCPPIGQRLVIQWNIPRKYKCYQNLHLNIRMRFRNRQEEIKKIPIDSMIGYYYYDLLNDEFCKKKGILTYIVELVGNDCILDIWQHQLWVELIQFPKNDVSEDNSTL